MGTIGSKFLGLIYRILVGQILGINDYGVISLMITVFSAATTVAYLGLPNGVQKYLAEYKGKGDWKRAKGTMRAGLNILTVSSFTIGTILFFLAPWLSKSIFNEPKAILPLRLVALAIPFQAYTNVLNNYSEAIGDMKPTVITGKIFSNIIKVVTASILIYFGFGYLGAAFGFALAFIAPTFLAYYFYRSKIPEEYKNAKPITNYSELFHHSWPLFAGSLLGIIIGDIDTLMLQAFEGTNEVGIYNAAYPLGFMIASFSGIFGNIFLSNYTELLAKNKEEVLSELFSTTIKWINFIAIPIFLVIFAFPKSALILFGSEYFAAAPLLRILSVGFLVNSLVGPSGRIYQGHGKTKLNLYTTILLAFFNLVLNYGLITVYGIIGAAYATSLSFIGNFIIHYILVNRFIDSNFFNKQTIKIWAAGFLSIAITYVVSSLSFGTVPKWFLIADLAIFGSLYSGLILLLDPFETEEQELLHQAGEKYGVNTKIMEKIINR